MTRYFDEGFAAPWHLKPWFIRSYIIFILKNHWTTKPHNSLSINALHVLGSENFPTLKPLIHYISIT